MPAHDTTPGDGREPWRTVLAEISRQEDLAVAYATDAQAYRELAQATLHTLFDLQVQYDSLNGRYDQLRAELRALRQRGSPPDPPRSRPRSGPRVVPRSGREAR